MIGLSSTNDCVTTEVPLVGSDAYTPTLFIRLIQKYDLETNIAKHLADSYGDRAFAVAELAAPTGKRWPKAGARISGGYPYLEAEIRWAVNAEFACTAVVTYNFG